MMRTMMAAALAAGLASGAGAVTLDFEDVALGTYTSLTTKGSAFNSVDPFQIVAGDPTGSTGNLSRVLYSATGSDLTLTFLAGEAFDVFNLVLAGAFTTNPEFAPVILDYVSDFSTAEFQGRVGDKAIVTDPDPFPATTYMLFRVDRGTGSYTMDGLDLGTPVSAVPLPASAALLLGALAGLGMAARRRAA